MDYSKSFRVIRAAYGLSQAELSAFLSIGPSQLSLIEAGKRTPSHRTIGDLSRGLGIPRAIIDLLAMTSEDIPLDNKEDVHALAHSLLRLLIDATPEGSQHKLRLK